jgi:nucleotide-binding universal stress UspA family protein
MAALDAVGATGDCEVLEGRPDEMIVEAAVRHDAEIVVVGTVGRTGLARVTLGSVAERVVRHAAVPVLVVRLC